MSLQILRIISPVCLRKIVLCTYTHCVKIVGKGVLRVVSVYGVGLLRTTAQRNLFAKSPVTEDMQCKTAVNYVSDKTGLNLWTKYFSCLSVNV
jgi:hypothetical protein